MYIHLAAERIELWIHYASKGAATTPSGQTYEYLGFIALSDNTSTGCKSRELQSVPVGPKKGTHLKLRLGTAHKNDMNKFDQVRQGESVMSRATNITLFLILSGCVDRHQCAWRKYEHRKRLAIDGTVEQ